MFTAIICFFTPKEKDRDTKIRFRKSLTMAMIFDLIVIGLFVWSYVRYVN